MIFLLEQKHDTSSSSLLIRRCRELNESNNVIIQCSEHIIERRQYKRILTSSQCRELGESIIGMTSQFRVRRGECRSEVSKGGGFRLSGAKHTVLKIKH